MTQCITARKGVLTYRRQSRRKPYLLQAADILEGTRTDRLYTVKTQISQLGSSKGTRTDRLQMRQASEPIDWMLSPMITLLTAVLVKFLNTVGAIEVTL